MALHSGPVDALLVLIVRRLEDRVTRDRFSCQISDETIYHHRVDCDCSPCSRVYSRAAI